MAANIIDGKEIARGIRAELRERVRCMREERNVTPCVAVVLVGDDPASGGGRPRFPDLRAL